MFSRFCLSQQNHRDARFGVVLQKPAGDTGFIPGASAVVVSLLPQACPQAVPSVLPDTAYHIAVSSPVPATSTRSVQAHLRLNCFHSFISSAAGIAKQFPLHSP